MEKMNCNICNVEFKSKRCFETHFTTRKHKIRASNDLTDKYKCKCGKMYTFKQGLYAHKKTCTYVPSDNTEPDLTNPTTVVVEKQEIDHLRDMVFCLQTQLQIQHQNQTKIETQLQTQTKILSQIQTQLQTQLPSNKVDAQTQTSATIIPKQDRKKISKKVREEIVNSQNNTCNQCERSLSKYFQIDHRVALQYGGTDDVDNLQALCSECHCKKSIIENALRHKIQDSVSDIIDTEFKKIDNL